MKNVHWCLYIPKSPAEGSNNFYILRLKLKKILAKKIFIETIQEGNKRKDKLGQITLWR